MYPHNEDTSAINDMTIILTQRNKDNARTMVTVTTKKTTTTSKDNNYITFLTTKHNKFKMTFDFFVNLKLLLIKKILIIKY